MAMGSLRKSDWKMELIPMEMEMMSTPSSTASSMALSMLELAQPPAEQALYTANLLDGEPPFATPRARP
ncbi:unnamed protein product [Spirodela intermedia]|uniref:Uncharacterized protein n=2 Tax=Spirodela intermedia TaxID=51605 RepID=A0A7I8IAA1_SPIIN|nr:unnamed protein product [Spirodela intermedia]CAA6654458.1 unnamed protein product [Spirodela intermedia]CAA7389057.1 unnamed protein product [Spirodela intermedia]